MVKLDFGTSSMTRVTRGSLGGKSSISNGILTTKSKSKLPQIEFKLSPKKEALLKKHSKDHTKRHMNYIRQTMVMGLSFKDAHQRAKQFIGI